MCKFAYTMMWPLRFPSKLKNFFQLLLLLSLSLLYVRESSGWFYRFRLAGITRDRWQHSHTLRSPLTSRLTTGFDWEHRIQCYDIFFFLLPISISFKYLLWDCSPESVDSLAIAWEHFRHTAHTNARTNNKIMIIERTCEEHTNELVQ